MKRKSRTPAEKQRESCGVWLDASALKRGKLPNLISKPTLRILNRLPSYSSPSKAPPPCTKQTTISTFFRAQQTGEREINANGQLLTAASNSASHLEDHEWPAGEPTLLPASLIQAVVMQECKQKIVEKPQHIFPWNLAPTEVQSNSHVVSYVNGRESASQRGDPLSFNFSQHHEDKEFFEKETLPNSPLREKNGGWKKEKLNTSASQSSPNPKEVSYKGTKDQRGYNSTSFCDNTSFMKYTDSENINPQLEKGIINIRPMKKVNKTPLGFGLETNDEISNSDKHENSEDVMSPLFTQDSDGQKVISHRSFHEPFQLSFQRKPQHGKSSSGGSRSHRDCFGACCSVERPHISVLADISQKPCYDLLFTEDSEGNKVIKH